MKYSHNNMKEHYVWYGTNDTAKRDNICYNGFQNVNDVFFAKSAEYHFKLCNQMRSKNKKNNHQCLFLCRIICDYQSNNYTIKIQESHQVYPQFVIKYNIIQQDNDQERKQPEIKPAVLSNQHSLPQHPQIYQNNVYIPESNPGAVYDLHALQNQRGGVPMPQSNLMPANWDNINNNSNNNIQHHHRNHPTWTCQIWYII